MRWILTTGLFLAAFAGLARAETTQVTTYVIKTQEERQSTRWTLTEWLRIKERMKMMDVWLAMFSDPKKDKFQPELMLSYGMTRSAFNYTADGGQTESGSLSGTTGKAQLWLTNLISSTVGVRTLNIDFGAEGYKRQTGDFSVQTAATNATGVIESTRQLGTEYYTGDLRIFGRNIQDSSIVLKYGRYTAKNSILDSVATGSTQSVKGYVAGAELQLYLLRFLGAEGNYLKFGDAHGAKGSDDVSGTYVDYMAFLEISLLRFTGGMYQEEWTVLRDGQSVKTKEKGSLAGLKLQF